MINIAAANITAFGVVEQTAAPSTPSAGKRKLFAKADGWYDLDDTGAVAAIASVGVGASDAGDVTYTPGTATDWDGDADPGDVDAALDQLAERVDDLEAVVRRGVLGCTLDGGGSALTAGLQAVVEVAE